MNAIRDTLEVLLKAHVTSSKMWEVVGQLFDNEDFKIAQNYDLGIYAQNGIQIIINKYREILLEWALNNINEVKEEERFHAERYLQTYNQNLFQFGDFDSLKVLCKLDRKLIKALMVQDYRTFLIRAEVAIDILSKRLYEKGVLIVLAQNVAAFLAVEEVYIKFSKLWIEYLLDMGEKEVARKELIEWQQILPEDEDIRMMAERLEE